MSGGPAAQLSIPIRRATPADAAALAAFGARVFSETFAAENTPEDMAAYLAAAYGPEIQRAELATEGNVFLVAERAGAIAGYAFLRDAPLTIGEPEPRAVEIVRFYVDGDSRGTGLTAALMAAAIEEARRRAVPVIWLGVWERNPRAIRFYEKHGFRDVGSHDFVLGRDVQRDRVMVRALGPREDGAR